MRTRNSLVRSAILLLLPTLAGGAGSSISAVASTAKVQILPEASESRRIELPSLEYDFELDLQCEKPALPERVSISVADTRRQFELANAEDRGELTASFEVPAEQIAPLATEGFCVAGSQLAQSELMIRDVLTTQISLRCGGSVPATHYVSLPLSVRLTCAAAEDQELESSIER
jgi:hypothetical protein